MGPSWSVGWLRPRFEICAGVLLLGWFSLLSITHWNLGLATSYDLGIFAQIAESYAQGRLPFPALLGFSSLGDHFSPINVVWALAWLVWPDPRSLLILQSASLAAGVVIVARLARARLVNRPGAEWAVVLAGGFGGQILPSVLFDVHEVSLGFPVMALFCAALIGGRERLLLVTSVLLVTVKEDLGLTVACAGVLWIWAARDRWRIGALVCGIGIAGLAVAAATISYFSPTGSSPQAGFFLGAGAGVLDAAAVAVRFAPVLLFLATTGLVGVASRWCLLAVPTLVWRMASSKSTHWSIAFHYDLLLWPIAMTALIDVCGRWWGPVRRRIPPRAILAMYLALVSSVAVGAAMISFRNLTPEGITGEVQAVTDVRAVAAVIPAGSRVGASNDVGVYILDSQVVFQYSPNGTTTGAVDYLLLHEHGDFAPTSCARKVLDTAISSGQAEVIARRGGYLAVRFTRPFSSATGCS